MTFRERVIAALNHQRSDRLPRSEMLIQSPIQGVIFNVV